MIYDAVMEQAETEVVEIVIEAMMNWMGRAVEEAFSYPNYLVHPKYSQEGYYC